MNNTNNTTHDDKGAPNCTTYYFGGQLYNRLGAPYDYRAEFWRGAAGRRDRSFGWKPATSLFSNTLPTKTHQSGPYGQEGMPPIFSGDLQHHVLSRTLPTNHHQTGPYGQGGILSFLSQRPATPYSTLHEIPRILGTQLQKYMGKNVQNRCFLGPRWLILRTFWSGRPPRDPQI